MARKKKLEGIETRGARYRGTAYVLGVQEKGPWVDDPEEAIEWREEKLHEARRGAISFTRLKFGDAVSIFCAGIEDGSIRNKSGRVFKPSVVRGYQRDLAVCRELIGADTYLERVRQPQAQVLLDRLRSQYRTDSRVRNVMVAFRSLYAWAVPRGYATTNPCLGLIIPVTDERARERIATLPEARLLIGALQLPYRTAFALACYAGLRAGELLALEWQSVDMGRPAIRVEQSLDLTTGQVIGVKTKAGERDVPICDALLAILSDHEDTFGRAGVLFPAQRARRGPRIREGGRMAHGTLRSHMTASWSGSGLEPLGLHEARHTFASMLIDSGASPKAIQTYMGHSSITITFDRYGHLMPGHEAEVLKRLNTYHEVGARTV